MATTKRRWLALTAVVATAAAALTLWLITHPPPPVVNPAQAQAMLPAINAYLSKHAAQLTGGYLASKYPKLKVENFCDVRIIEIRPAGQQWHVGMDVNCGEFARRGRILLEGAGGEDDDVMTLARSHGRYRAVSLLIGPIYYDPDWAAKHFSPGAAAEIDSATPPMAPYPARQARRAFGLPSASRVIEG
jgi:hypothetical protein